MTKLKEKKRQQAEKNELAGPTPEAPNDPPLAARLREVLLAATIALLVATPLIPSEAAIVQGAFAPLAMLWCLLLVAWAAALLLVRQSTFRWSWVEAATLGLVGWHSLAAIWAAPRGNARQALNAMWLWIGYGIALVLLRQFVRSQKQSRAIVAVMIALAVCLSMHGYYQYFVGFPQMRAEFHKNPEQMLTASGISTDLDSPEGKQFANRIESREPLASFALTNSLAGFLTPWLVATLGIFLLAWNLPAQRRAAVGAACLAVALTGCLLLTKSRTGILATGFGTVLILLYGRRGGWRIDWKIPAAGAAIVLLLAGGAVLSGGLDAKVLSEAPKSLIYRAEYWRATISIIAKHSLLGCGPGNFQSQYAHFKLPQASEMVADPHNALLEIWATAGTPAMLLFLAVVAAFVRLLAAAAKSTFKPATESASIGEVAWIYGGAGGGLLVGFLLGGIVGYPLELIAFVSLPVVWLLGIPAAAIALWLLHAWVMRGEMMVALPVVALAALGVNLLAAGSLSFPGVFESALILIPLAMQTAGAFGTTRIATRPLAVGIAASAVALVIACHFTAYRPVLVAQARLLDSRFEQSRGNSRDAEAAALAAAAADPWSPEPWRFLAEIRLQNWLRTNRKAAADGFVAAANEFQRLDSQSYRQFEQRGNWFLQAYRHSSDREMLLLAREAYAQAIVLFPNSALQHAQHAWVLHMLGRDQAASYEALEATRLDDLNPHREQKLANVRLFDPKPVLGDDAKPQTAGQIITTLRNNPAVR
jgi:O-antigen ligase